MDVPPADVGPEGHLGPEGHVRPADVDALRADLDGYTVDAVDDLLGPVAHGALGREDPWPAREVVDRAMATGETLATLVGAFVLGRSVRRHQLAAALPTLGLSGALRLGLVAAAGESPQDEVRALVDCRPYAAIDERGSAAWWVISDPSGAAVAGPLRSDHVLGVGGASLTLARCSFRRPVDRLLDLGTGCGVQSLHASRHAASVVATDLSRRALRHARLTLALARVDADLRAGDLFAPVAGETFDQVVSNPPFVITPRGAGVRRYAYRDAGAVGDAVVERLVTGMGSVLAPGGTAQLLGNWEHRRGLPWTERVGDWLDRSGLDGWIIQREVQDPAEYAELWIRDGGRPDDETSERLLRAWLADFAARRVDAVGFGLIVLRRPYSAGAAHAAGAAHSGGAAHSAGAVHSGVAGAGRVRRIEDVPSAGHGPMGEHLAVALDAQVRLAALDDAGRGGGGPSGVGQAGGLVDLRLTVAPDVTEERHYRPGQEDPSVILLRQGAGFGRAVRVDTALAAFVGACDGELPVGRLCGAVAQLLERPVDEVLAEVLPSARALIADGLLVLPAESAASSVRGV